MFTVLQSFAAMTVTGMLPQLQCNHNQLTCALQTIICQCVVTGTGQFITWKLDMKLIAQFDVLGQSVFSDSNYPATAENLENGLSSNVSFSAELKSDPVTVQCSDVAGKSSAWSFPIFGPFIDICINIFIIKIISNKFVFPL